MFPVLYDIDLGRFGQFTIGTYGLFYAAGFLLALRLAIVYARREGIDAGRVVDLGIVTLLAGFIGAKLALYLVDARFYFEHPMEMVRNLRSAGVFYGGFALAALAALLYVRRHALPLGRMADSLAPPLALGQAIGRLGCFAAGCCYGKSCDLAWAVTFSDERAYRLTGVPLGVPLHPTQLYHAAADFAVLGLTMMVMKRRRFPGQVFWVYVLGYAVLRAWIEAYRGDAVRGLFFGDKVSTSQLIAVPAALVAVLCLIVLTRRSRGISRGRGAAA